MHIYTKALHSKKDCFFFVFYFISAFGRIISEDGLKVGGTSPGILHEPKDQ